MWLTGLWHPQQAMSSWSSVGAHLLILCPSLKLSILSAAPSLLLAEMCRSVQFEDFIADLDTEAALVEDRTLSQDAEGVSSAPAPLKIHTGFYNAYTAVKGQVSHRFCLLSNSADRMAVHILAGLH